MDKQSLAQRLNYPSIWLESGLYTDELYEGQLAIYQKEFGEGESTGSGDHFRYGAFHFLLKRNPDERTLGLLLDAAIADPDLPMAGAAIRDIIEHPLSTRAMLDKALAIVARSRDYHCSPTKLERGFVARTAGQTQIR